MSAGPTFQELMADPPADPVIPFGKHRGKFASQIDVEYLDWLIGQHWLRGSLRAEIEKHLAGRSEWHRLGDD